MRFKLFLGAVLACGLVSAQAAPAAEAAQKRVFKGKTAQKRSVRLVVHNRWVKILRFKAQLSCSNGTLLILDESGFVRTPTRNGRFRDVQVGKTDEVFIRGRARQGVVRGRLRVKDKLRRGVRCQSRWIKFTAKPKNRKRR